LTFEETALAELNRTRAAVTKPPNYIGAWSAIPPLNWSDTLATSAQSWANGLRDQYHCELARNETTPYGELLAYGSVGYGFPQAVVQWSEEKATYTYNAAYQGEAGTYLQLVWRASTQVGCATAACDTGWHVYVCYFDPPGNVLGAAPY
jgi:pathogenesis-related protein 1